MPNTFLFHIYRRDENESLPTLIMFQSYSIKTKVVLYGNWYRTITLVYALYQYI